MSQMRQTFPKPEIDRMLVEGLYQGTTSVVPIARQEIRALAPAVCSRLKPGAKALVLHPQSARLKSCPDTTQPRQAADLGKSLWHFPMSLTQ
jgi:hypothetical protein